MLICNGLCDLVAALSIDGGLYDTVEALLYNSCYVIWCSHCWMIVDYMTVLVLFNASGLCDLATTLLNHNVLCHSIAALFSDSLAILLIGSGICDLVAALLSVIRFYICLAVLLNGNWI